MARKYAWKAVASLLLITAALSVAGCFNTTFGPNLGLLGYPIPVSPYFQDEFEDIAWYKERYKKVTILGPNTLGPNLKALDAPSDDEIMTALERARPVEGGSPLLYTKQRNNVRIVKYKIADYVDPPRVMPQVGPVQLHHAHYLCKVYFSERTIVGWPVPYTVENEDAQEVVYVDHDHLHMYGNVNPGPSADF